MAWLTKKDVARYTYNQFKGNFLGFIAGTSATSLVSTFFETRKVSNLWGLTARKTVVSGDTFRFLEWSCALLVGFVAFEVVNNLVKEKLSIQLKRISSFTGNGGLNKLISRFTESCAASANNGNESAANAPKRTPD
jgi:hypothetical protein